MYIFASSMAVIWLALILAAPLYVQDKDNLTWVVSYQYYAGYSILTLVYTAIIIYLMRTLKEMKNFFTQEYRHIVLQFFFFLFAFIAKIILQILFSIGSNRGWTDYANVMLQAISYCFVDIMPISFMLHSHYRTFSRDNRAQKQAPAVQNTSKRS